MTRRSLLRTAGYLSAHSFTGLGTGSVFGLVTRPVRPEKSRAPTEKSNFVLFEGPWLFDQPTTGMLRATTFGQLGTDPSDETHRCEVGLGAASSSVLINPLDPAEEPLLLPINSNWTIAVSSYRPAADFLTVFGTPFGRDPFVWIRNQDPKVKQRTGDRSVCLPLPTTIHVGGRLENAIVTDSSGLLAESATPPQPYVTTILEYAQQTGAIEFLLATKTTEGTIQLPMMSHLIFRMEHKADASVNASKTDVDQIRVAFMELASRITTTPPAKPIELSALKDSSCDVGKNIDGFEQSEMGIDLIQTSAGTAKENFVAGRRHMSYQEYANYSGGGIVVGS
jgi:hypothetical protein